VYTVRAIQEPVFSVAHADFEGGGNGHGYGDYVFGHLCATKPQHLRMAFVMFGI
jgi:hypothetical protein